MPFAVCAFYGYGIVRFASPALRTAFACAIAWSLAGQYFLNRGMWSAMLPGETALSSSLESYRREVERQRSLFSRFLLWQFGPLMFAIATLILLILTLGMGNRGMPLDEALLKMSPFLTLMAIWIVGFFVIRMRAQRQLQREIAELNEIERANR